MPSSELLTTDQVADKLRIDRRSVVGRVRTGRLRPATKLPGRTGAYLFDRAYIEGIAAREKTEAHQLRDALADHDDVKAGA